MNRDAFVQVYLRHDREPTPRAPQTQMAQKIGIAVRAVGRRTIADRILVEWITLRPLFAVEYLTAASVWQ